MSSTLTIPAAAVADVREALLCLLGDPVESIAHALTEPERELHPEWFEDGRRQFEDVCRLLDAIGWSASETPREVEASRDDEPTIRRAVESYLPMVEQWLSEADKQRTRREHRGSVQAMWTFLGTTSVHEQAA